MFYGFLYKHFFLTLFRYCRLRPYGPESIDRNEHRSKYQFSQPPRCATARCLVSFSSVHLGLRGRQDVGPGWLAACAQQSIIGRKTWDAAGRTMQSLVATVATMTSENTGTGLNRKFSSPVKNPQSSL